MQSYVIIIYNLFSSLCTLSSLAIEQLLSIVLVVKYLSNRVDVIICTLQCCTNYNLRLNYIVDSSSSKSTINCIVEAALLIYIYYYLQTLLQLQLYQIIIYFMCLIYLSKRTLQNIARNLQAIATIIYTNISLLIISFKDLPRSLFYFRLASILQYSRLYVKVSKFSAV